MGEMKMSNEKKKSQLLRFNVGGGAGVVLGGVVLMGGGLVVAGLMAAFSIMKKRNSAKDYKKQEDSTPSEGSQGLSFVLQNPSTVVPQNSCCTSHGTTTIRRTESLMDSKELVAAHNMTLGDKTLPIMDGEKEILSYDELKKEINESCNEIKREDEPVPITMIKNESSENLQPMENTEIKREDESAENLPMQFVKAEEQEQGEDDDYDGSEEPVVENEEDVAEGELDLKENSPMQSVEEEAEEEEEEEEEEVGDDDDDDNNNCSGEEDDSEDATEKEEESSDGTGSSSMESSVEAIWPTEMIEALSRELKEINASNQNSGEKKIAKPESHDYLNRRSDGSTFNEYHSNNETTKNSVMLNEKITQELGMEKVKNVNLPKREVFVWSVAVVILLLLLLHIHRTVSVHVLSYQNSVVGPQG